MFRSCFILGLQLCLIIKLCNAVESSASKRVQKCEAYSTKVFGNNVPTCESSSGSIQTISINEFPHIAILGYMKDNNPSQYYWHCHGTLVSSRYVLTTAHCLRSPTFTIAKVRLGATSTNYSDTSKTSDYDIELIVSHPLYKASSYYNDIALIKLSHDVAFSDSVRPICLPDSDVTSNKLYQVNYEAVEDLSSTHKPLTKYEHSLVTNAECNEKYSIAHSRKIHNGITDEMICSTKPLNLSAGYTAIGESGAPWYIDHPQLACSHIQLGILTFGYPVFAEWPDVGTKLYTFAGWIESVIWADAEYF